MSLRSRSPVVPSLAILAALVIAGPSAAQCIDYHGTAGWIVGHADTAGGAYEVAVQGHYAYVAVSGYGLQVIDVANPEAPVVVGQLDSPYTAWAIAVAGNYAYIAGVNYGLEIIDVSDPAHPVHAGRYDTTGQAYDVAVQGTMAYVADGAMGFVAIDCANPTNPVRRAWINTMGAAMCVAADAHHAYVGDHYGTGVVVFDVSNPLAIHAVGLVDTPGQAYGLSILGDHVYLADGLSGLTVLDVANPAAPTIVGALPLPDWGVAVVAKGSYARLASAYAGFLVVDITDPTHPALVASVDTPGWGSGLDLAGGYAYIADEVAGLQILPDQCDGLTGVPAAAKGLALTAAPNPFNPRTRFNFTVPREGRVRLDVFDATGRRVCTLLDGDQTAGSGSVTWNGSDDAGRALPSGTYVCRLSSGAGVQTTKVGLLK